MPPSFEGYQNVQKQGLAVASDLADKISQHAGMWNIEFRTRRRLCLQLPSSVTRKRTFFTRWRR